MGVRDLGLKAWYAKILGVYENLRTESKDSTIQSIIRRVSSVMFCTVNVSRRGPKMSTHQLSFLGESPRT